MSVESAAVRRGELSDSSGLGDGERQHAATRYAEQVRAFQAHAGVFVVGIASIVGVNLLVNLAAGIAGSISAWWSLWTLVGWSAGVAIHGLVVRLNRPDVPVEDAAGGAS